jgi:hypothetical protein
MQHLVFMKRYSAAEYPTRRLRSSSDSHPHATAIAGTIRYLARGALQTPLSATRMM